MPTCFSRGQHRRLRSQNPRTKVPLMYAVYLILGTQADLHRIPKTGLTEQKRITAGVAEHRGNQNVGVSTCTIVGIFRCVCERGLGRALASLYYAYHVRMNNFQKNNFIYLRAKNNTVKF